MPSLWHRDCTPLFHVGIPPPALATIAGREAYMRDDQFSQSLEMLDNGCLPDSAVYAEDVLLILAQHYAYVFPSDSTLAMLAGLGPNATQPKLIMLRVRAGGGWLAL